MADRIAVSYVGGFLEGVDVYLNRGKGVFAGPTAILSGGGSFGFVVGDFNGDGRPDSAISAANNDQAFATVLPICGDKTPPRRTVRRSGPRAAAERALQRWPGCVCCKIVTIHYAGDPAQLHNEAFNDWIAGSQWLATVGASYGVAPGVDLAEDRAARPMQRPPR